MSTAKVVSIDALRAFRTALIKFAESANVALADAEGEIHATLRWLERDQLVWWTTQIRKRHEMVEKAKEALRHKQLYKSPTGGKQSDVDEQKSLARAKAALEEAEVKLANTRRSIQRLNKEFLEYRGPIQRFTSTVQVDLPAAVAELDRLTTKLDEYATLSAPPATAASAQREEPGGMKRSDEDAPLQQEMKTGIHQPPTNLQPPIEREEEEGDHGRA